MSDDSPIVSVQTLKPQRKSIHTFDQQQNSQNIYYQKPYKLILFINNKYLIKNVVKELVQIIFIYNEPRKKNMIKNLYGYFWWIFSLK